MTAAAVVGRDFDADLVAAVLEEGEDRVLDALELAIEARLVTEIPAVPGRFAFSHALVVHALYDGLTATRRARLHRRVAQALEARCGNEPRERLPELAAHWLATHVRAENTRVVDYARRAGDQALESLAPHEAARWYERALTLVGDFRGAEWERCELLVALGVAQRQAGDGRFRATLLEAAAQARNLGNVHALVRAALANNRGDVSTAGEVDSERLAVLEAALAAIGPVDIPGRARLLAMVALESSYGGDWERRQALADEALAIARRLNGRMDEAEERTYEAFQIGQADGEPDAPTVLAAQLVTIRWDQGRLAEIEPMLQRAVADNPGIPAFRAVLAQAHCELDRFDDARQLFDRDAAGDFGDYVYDCTWLCSAVLLADVCAQLSDSTRAPALYERLAPWRDQVAFSGASVYGSVAHYLGQLAGTAGRYDTADSDFAEAARRHEEMGAVAFLARTRLAWARMLARRREPGDGPRAAELAGQAADAARRVGAATIDRRAGALLRGLGDR